MKIKFVVRLIALASLSASNISFAGKDEFIEIVEAKDHTNYWVAKKLPGSKRQSQQAQESNGGCVSVAMIINADGNTSDLRVVGSFPDNALDEVAIDIFRRARFKPAESNEDREPIFIVFTWNAIPTVKINGRIDK